MNQQQNYDWVTCGVMLRINGQTYNPMTKRHRFFEAVATKVDNVM